MSEAANPFDCALIFDSSEKIAANENVINRIARVLFVFFQPEDGQLDDFDKSELFSDAFGISATLMAVLGMDIIGENIDGNYVVNLKPYKSLDDFGKQNGIR